MRRCLPAVVIALGLAAGAIPASALDLPAAARPAANLVDRSADVITSSNVEYVATIPLDSPGVGGDVVRVGEQVRFYVTGAKGISIYDVTDPALPVPLGFGLFHHAQNEDVEVSADGSRVVIAADGSILVPVAPENVGIHVFDTSDPLNIVRIGTVADGSHTAECADDTCEWIWASDGQIWDATDLAGQGLVQAGYWNRLPDGTLITGTNTRGGHAVERDATGLMIVDNTTRVVFDVTGAFVAGSSPAAPAVLATGQPKGPDGGLQHNNVRPNAEQWVPRPDDDGTVAGDGSPMRPGELLLGNSESNLNPSCPADAGGLTTWDMRNFERDGRLVQLSAFRPVNGTYADGNPALNALGCSGHWFTYDDGVIAAGWYEHGGRFVGVDEATGELTDLGFFQPLVAESSAAHWVATSTSTSSTTPGASTSCASTAPRRSPATPSCCAAGPSSTAWARSPPPSATPAGSADGRRPARRRPARRPA